MQWFLLALTISVAGGLGSVIRWLLSKLDGWLPWGLLLSNSIAAGFVGWLLAGPDLSADYLAVATIGFAGGLSTFSTVAKASFDFVHRGRIVQSLLTLVTNVFVPLLVVVLATSNR